MAGRSRTLTDEDLYLRVRQIIEEMPSLRVERTTPELAMWLGKASFLVEEAGNIPDIAEFRTACSLIATIASNAPEQIPTILYRTLARAEARAPSSVHGTFIPAGKPFDALVAVSNLFGEAKGDVLVVDPYAEANLLERFLLAVPEQVMVRLLADSKSLKPTLKPAAEAWAAQFGPRRPLEVRRTPKGALHDRLIVLDRKDVWLLGQSFNQLATRSNTYLAKAPDELAELKVHAYEAVWQQSRPL
jgi:hypothetical protein